MSLAHTCHAILQGAASAEEQAVSIAGSSAQGATAYLNLETGDCHGDDTAVRCLIRSGIDRAVFGLRHPLRHCRGLAISALQAAGIEVEVVGETPFLAPDDAQAAAQAACLSVNEVSALPSACPASYIRLSSHLLLLDVHNQVALPVKTCMCSINMSACKILKTRAACASLSHIGGCM